MRRGIDHLVLGVADLEAAAALYRALGFTVTPRARHSWGTDNCLVQMERCFLELLTVSRPELIPDHGPRSFSFGAYNQSFLGRREGMTMLVFESADAETDRQEFEARGVGDYDTFHFERWATLPDGGRARVAFSLAFAVCPGAPDTAFFTCQQHAPQYFWKPEYQAHANGATVVEEVVMVAEPTSALAEFFARVQEPDSVAGGDERLLVHTPRGAIIVYTPDRARRRWSSLDLSGFPQTPFFLGYVLRVSDAGRVAMLLGENGVPFSVHGGSVQVGPEDGLGVLIEFREPGRLSDGV